MAKTDWAKLQAEFTREHLRTGISAQDWCEKKGIKYASARRYIKPQAIKAAQNDAAQIAPHCAKTKDGSVRKTARSKMRKVTEVTRDEKEGDVIDEQANHHSDSSDGSASKSEGRASNGRFAPGNQHSRGASGNPHPVASFKPGQGRAPTHGGYAKYLNADEYFADARNMSLTDELDFCRARTISLTRTLESLAEIGHNMQNEATVRLDAISKMLAAESALDRNTARIESLERTLDQLYINTLQAPRLQADTLRIKAATRKLTAEADKLTNEGKGTVTPIGEVLMDIQASGSDGLLN